jgi:hypothetical protein
MFTLENVNYKEVIVSWGSITWKQIIILPYPTKKIVNYHKLRKMDLKAGMCLRSMTHYA